MTDDIQALRDRVSGLEERVEELAAQLDGTAEESTQRRESGLDHYDETALDRMPRDKAVGFGAVKTAYQNAGVRDHDKIKDRLKHLVQLGKVEQTDRFSWKVVEDE